MTTITTPLRRVPRRAIRPSFAPVRANAVRYLDGVRRFGATLNSDDRATLCDLTLRPYPEARSGR